MGNYITNLVKKYGAENVMVLAPARPLRNCLFITYTSSNDEPEPQLHRIVEARYKVENNYKIELEPINERYAGRSYYISDLEDILNRDDTYKILVTVEATEQVANT